MDRLISCAKLTNKFSKDAFDKIILISIKLNLKYGLIVMIPNKLNQEHSFCY